jgi:DNA-binding LacI/PurR family transcriptional regulator
MGENAVRVLLDILNRGNDTPELVTLPHTLVVRASTTPPGRW